MIDENGYLPLSVMRAIWLADAIARYPLDTLIERTDEGIARSLHEAALNELKRLTSEAMNDAADYETEMRALLSKFHKETGHE